MNRRNTVGVKVGRVQIGGGAPVVVQSMTNTDTADIEGTVQQVYELARAGSELVRITVNLPPAAAAVPEIRKRVQAAGVNVPLVSVQHQYIVTEAIPGVTLKEVGRRLRKSGWPKAAI